MPHKPKNKSKNKTHRPNLLATLRHIFIASVVFFMIFVLPGLIVLQLPDYTSKIKNAKVNIDSIWNNGVYFLVALGVIVSLAIVFLSWCHRSNKRSRERYLATDDFQFPENGIDYTKQDLKLFDDTPTPNLTFGRLDMAKMIADILHGSSQNHVYGLNSPWGRGKTSIMRAVRRLMHRHSDGDASDVVTVWLPAWTVESKLHPLITLIDAIANEINKQLPMEHPLQDVVGCLTRWAKKAGLKGLILGKSLTFDRNLMSNSGQCNVQQIVRELREIARRCEGCKVVVFIDDVDRCEAPVALELLDTLKAVFHQDMFIFVVAYDRDIILRHLEKRFLAENPAGIEEKVGIYDKPMDRARAYLDKIIQTDIELPSMHESYQDFLSQLLSSKKHDAVNVKMRLDNEFSINLCPRFIDFMKLVLRSNPRNTIQLLNNIKIDFRLANDGFYLKRYEKLLERNEDKPLTLPIDELMYFCLAHRLAMLQSEKSLDHIDLLHKANSPSAAEEFMRGLIGSLPESKKDVGNQILGKHWLSRPYMFLLMMDIYEHVEEAADETPEELSRKIARTALVAQLGLDEEKEIDDIKKVDVGTKHLDLADTAFSELAVLLGSKPEQQISALIGLKGLCLTRTSITRIDNIHKFDSLTHLRIRGCNIEDLKPLQSLNQLEVLDVGMPVLADDTEHARWQPVFPESLRVLYIEGCPFGDICFIKNMENLETLWIDENDVEKWFPNHDNPENVVGEFSGGVTVKINSKVRSKKNPDPFIWNGMRIEILFQFFQ